MNRWMLVLAGFAVTAGAAEPVVQPPATAPSSPPATSQSMEPRVNTSAAAATPATKPPAAPPAGPRTSRDRLELEATQITGNRELPRVMYVVPWKRPDLGDHTGRPVNSLLDEVLAPVDRDVFRRQNRYYDALRPDTGGK